MDIKLVLNENFVSISAEVILNSIQKKLKQRPTCSIVLSGGSTPIPVYEKIIKIWHEYKIDWSACYFFGVTNAWFQLMIRRIMHTMALFTY